VALPALLLAACGGGGSSGSQAPVSKCPAGELQSFDGQCLSNAEFAQMAQDATERLKLLLTQRIFLDQQENSRAAIWPLEKINAYEALAHLELTRGPEAVNAPGKDVTIGFIDSGIHGSHHVFEKASADAPTRSITEELLLGAPDEEPDEFSHGTAVAGIAAGRYLASGANIKMFAIPLGSGGSGSYTPITLEELSVFDYTDEQISRRVLGRDLDILNLSIGYTGGILRYTEEELRNNYGRLLAALAQSDVEDKTILVWAAGNARGYTDQLIDYLSPEILPGLPARIEELQGHSIAVVSIRQDGTISNFSNRCGIAKDFCIAAPGERVLVAYKDTDDINERYELDDGTSYSAPMVSGGLAIMKQLFRDQLSSEQLVSRLFDTANKTGDYGQQDIYGQGLMDLGAATNPWGQPAFMGSQQSITQATTTPLTSSFLKLGAPLGDGLTRSLQSEEIAAFDSLGAPFWFQASQFTIPASSSSVANRLQQFLNPLALHTIPETWQFSLQEQATSHETGHLALTDGASRFTMASPQGITATVFREPQKLEGLSFSYTPFTGFSLQAGYLNEHKSLLGSYGDGAFGAFSGETLFLGAGLNTTAGGWQLGAHGEIGWANPSVTSSQFIDNISSLSTSAFRLQASRSLFDNGSTLQFSLSQPLRVERGSAGLSLPTGRTQDGVVIGKSFSTPLMPSGRHLDLTAQLHVPLSGGELSLGVTRSGQPQHQLASATQWSFFTGYRTSW